MESIINNSTFWISISGILSGLIIALITSINKSKCSNIECCCGLFKCVRNIPLEVELEEHNIDHRVLTSEELPLKL